MSKLTRVYLRVFMIVLLAAALPGCNEETKQALDQAKADAEKSAAEMKDKADEAVADAKEKADEAMADAKDKANDAVSQLSEQALGFLGPIKEQLSGLSALKDKPAELKTAVEGILSALSSKAAGIALPEGIQSVIATITEKLTSLKGLLGSETPDQAQVDEHLKDIDEAAKGL